MSCPVAVYPLLVALVRAGTRGSRTGVFVCSIVRRIAAGGRSACGFAVFVGITAYSRRRRRASHRVWPRLHLWQACCTPVHTFPTHRLTDVRLCALCASGFPRTPRTPRPSPTLPSTTLCTSSAPPAPVPAAHGRRVLTRPPPPLTSLSHQVLSTPPGSPRKLAEVAVPLTQHPTGWVGVQQDLWGDADPANAVRKWCNLCFSQE